MKASTPAGSARPGRRLGLLAGATGLLLGAVCFVPARGLDLLINQASADHVRLLNARGTLWRGQADLVLAGGPGSAAAIALPQGVRWRLTPAWSQGPVLRLELVAPCCVAQGLELLLGVAAGSARLELAPHSSQWPAAWLAGLGAPWNTVRLQGQLQLQTAGTGIEWTQGRARLTGPFELQALDLSSSLSTLKPLGSYRLRFEPDADGSPRLQLDTLRGNLRLSGQAQWSGGRLRFQGQAEAAPDSERSLSNLLNILGRRDGARAHISL